MWEDTSAYTIKRFGVVNRYEEKNSQKLRKTALKSAMDEILWIWQKKSIIFMIFTAISGITRMAPLEKRMVISCVKHQYKEGMMDEFSSAAKCYLPELCKN